MSGLCLLNVNLCTYSRVQRYDTTFQEWESGVRLLDPTIHIHILLCHEFYFYEPYTFFSFQSFYFTFIMVVVVVGCVVLDDMRHTQYTAVHYNSTTYYKTW